MISCQAKDVGGIQMVKIAAAWRADPAIARPVLDGKSQAQVALNNLGNRLNLVNDSVEQEGNSRCLLVGVGPSMMQVILLQLSGRLDIVIPPPWSGNKKVGRRHGVEGRVSLG